MVTPALWGVAKNNASQLSWVSIDMNNGKAHACIFSCWR